MEPIVLLEHGSLERLPRNPQTVLATEGAEKTIKKIMRLRKSEINFFFAREGEGDLYFSKELSFGDCRWP